MKRRHNKFLRNILIISLCLGFGVFAYIHLFSQENTGREVQESQKQVLIHEHGVESKESGTQDIWVETERVEAIDGRAQLLLSYPLTKNDLINEDLKRAALAFKKKFLKEVETGEILSYEIHYTQHFDVAFSGKKYLMFVVDQYVSTGNTGDERFTSFIYDRETGRRLTPQDIFRGDYLELLSKKSFEILKRAYEERMKTFDFGPSTTSLAKKEFFESGIEFIKEGTAPRKENFHTLVFDGEGYLHIYFNKYQVGPGSDGVSRIKIKTSELRDILRPNFQKVFIHEKVEEPRKPILSQHKSVEKSHDCSQEKCLALTFDDGPSRYTEGLLDILKDKGVHASFFVLGKSAKVQPRTIARTISEGHQIGNHSWDHKDLARLSDDGVREEINQTNEVIEGAAGTTPHILRPPYGSQNARVRELANMPLILWNIDPEDWKKPGVDTVVERMTKVKRGDIILAHDIHAETIQAIPRVIDILQGQGYVFVTIDELLPHQEKGKRYYSQYFSK